MFVAPLLVASVLGLSVARNKQGCEFSAKQTFKRLLQLFSDRYMSWLGKGQVMFLRGATGMDKMVHFYLGWVPDVEAAPESGYQARIVSYAVRAGRR